MSSYVSQRNYFQRLWARELLDSRTSLFVQKLANRGWVMKARAWRDPQGLQWLEFLNHGGEGKVLPLGEGMRFEGDASFVALCQEVL